MIRSVFCTIALALISVSFTESGFAATKVVTLTTTGTIQSGPDWQDGSPATPTWTQPVNSAVELNEINASINNVTFDFSGFIPSGSAGVPIDSDNHSIRLTNANKYPASVSLVRPSGCSIGTASIASADVHFMLNEMAITTNSSFNIPSGGTQIIAIRFASKGAYGNHVGAVTCATQGSLTYVY